MTISRPKSNDPPSHLPTRLSREDGGWRQAAVPSALPQPCHSQEGAGGPAVTSTPPRKIYFNFSGSE